MFVVMPGFVDMHAHTGGTGKAPQPEYTYELWMGHGITTSRGVGHGPMTAAEAMGGSGDRPRRTLVLCLLLAVGLAGGLGLAEVVLRTAGLGDPIVYSTNTAYRYAPAPNQRVNRRRDAWITINAAGYRSTESWGKPAAFKVLWIGDSVTWGGTYIGDADTFAELSCVRIEQATGAEAVCGNGGVNAYGVDNMVSRLRYDRAGDDANVIVAVVGWSDFFRSKSNIGGNSWVRHRRTGPFRALAEFAAFQTARFLVFLQGDYPCDDPYGPAVARESLDRLLQTLAKKQDQGKTVLLARYPVVHEAAGGVALDIMPWCIGNVSTLLADMEQSIRASSVPYLDLTTTVRQALEVDSSEPVFYDKWGHLDVRGHRLFAQAIADRILDLVDYSGN